MLRCTGVIIMMKSSVITKFREFLWYFHSTLYFIEHFLLSDCYPWSVMKIKVLPFSKIKSQPTVNWRSKETEFKKLPLKKELKFHFLDSMYKWEHTVFIFLWYISLSIMHSKSITFVEYCRIPFFSLHNHIIYIHTLYVESNCMTFCKRQTQNSEIIRFFFITEVEER